MYECNSHSSNIKALKHYALWSFYFTFGDDLFFQVDLTLELVLKTPS